MKNDIKSFRVREGPKVDLKHWPTKVQPFYKSKHDYENLLTEHVEKLSAQQSLLYAQDRYALLLIFQAMDAAGKDGAIKHVMSDVNPQRCQVFSFKHTSAQELDHDSLCRTTRCLPERGRWKDYQRAYEACLSATSTKAAPWYLVPADDKENARLIISQVILDSLGELKLGYPKVDKDRRKELRSSGKLLER